ncbi:MAG: hypothetical protein FWE71_00950 [Nocardioidaceae bacterium]|nr:hypothetical protein [Nocardioidaceae bacterium]MCL2614426.1 hypothetical protein [Nocardioidaceae bacterium]
MSTRLYAAAAAALLVNAVLVVAGGGAADAGTTAGAHPACATDATWQCRAIVLGGPTTSGSGASTKSIRPHAVPTGAGWGASQLKSTYNPAGLAPSGTPTIAIVDAFDYANAAADLAKYRSANGLPACTVASGCLSIVNQNLKTSPLPPAPTAKDDWTSESALDLDMASAVCPRCHLRLVEATNDTGNGLFTGAVAAGKVDHYVSMSWGGADDSSIPRSEFANPSTLFTAASGDDGYDGTSEPTGDAPSTMTDVVAVGGVQITNPGDTPASWSDSFGKSGSSCSTLTPTPPAQSGLDTGCQYKASSDVSAVADTGTAQSGGLAIYDTSNGNTGWEAMAGTSAAAPIVAALYAIVGNHTDPSTPYDASGDTKLMTDVTTGGDNGTCGAPLCTPGTGWDGPTGIGTPVTPEALGLPLGSMGLAASRLQATYRKATSVSTAITLVDDKGTRQTLKTSTATVTGLPTGLHAAVSGGDLKITGTPTQTPSSGRATVDLTGTTPAGRSASGTVTLPWTIGKATFVATKKVAISGTVAHGKTVRAVMPALHTNTATGALVTPSWKVTWRLAGKVVHTGTTYRLPASAKGRKLQARAQASKTYYATKTFSSATSKVQ